MTLRNHLGRVKAGLLCSMMSRPVPLGGQAPFVSFCFDDFPRTAYTVGGMLLKSFGVHGTFYASPGLIGTSNALGEQFQVGDLDALLTDNHELGSHTFNHVSCRDLPLRSFEHEVRRGRAELSTLTGYDPSNFAYPFGQVSLRSKRTIGSQMASCRGIYGGVNEQFADLNLLRANCLYGEIDQLPRVMSLISQCVSSQGWLIFYTHDVRENPSPYGCTPALLDRTLLLAMQRGCRIVSVREALEMLPGVQSTLPLRSLTPTHFTTHPDIRMPSRS